MSKENEVVWGLVNEVASEMGEYTSVEMSDEQMDAIMKKNRELLEENKEKGLLNDSI